MNKTYKVIYNRTRCMYQVVSELAKGRTKSETPEMLKTVFSKHGSLARGIVMAVLSMSLAMPVGIAVQAEDRTDTSGNTTSTSNTKTADTTDTTTTDKTVTVKDGTILVGSGAASVSSSTDTTTNTTTVTIDVPKNGKVEANNTGLVTGGTVYTAITDANTALSNKIGTLDANGNYIQKDASVSSNLSKLDTQVKTNTDAINTNKNSITTNTANIAANTSDITGLKDLSNVTDVGKTVIKKQAKQAVQVAATGNATVTTTGSADDDSTLTYTINVSNNGAISSGDTNLVSGGTMYSELRPASTGTYYYISNANTTADNLIALDTNLKNVIDAIGLDADDTTTSYTSKLNKYFKVNSEVTTSTDGKTKTYVPDDAAANGTNSVAIGPSAQAGEKSTDATTSTTTVTGGTSSTAIGDSAKANGNTSVALGASAQVLNTTDQDGKTTATITGSTAIGSGAKVNGATDANAIGTSAQVNETATGGIAFGKGAVTGEDKGTVTVGDVTADVAAVGGKNSVALGTDAKASGNTALALGKGAQVNNYTTQSGTTVTKTVNSGSTAIGSGAVVTGANDAVALGTGAKVEGTGTNSDDSMAIGKGASVATAKDAMAFGTSAAVASGANNAIALGNTAKANTSNTTAIGYNASATGAGAVAIGENTTTETEGGITIGSGTKVSGKSIVIGYATDYNGNAVNTESQNTDAIAIGNGAQANANDSVSIGHQAGKGTSEGRTSGYGSLIAIGTNAGNNVKGMQNVALGSGAGSNVKSSYNVAIGSNAGAGINYAAATDANPQNGYNVSIGYEANYQSADDNAKNIAESIAIGHSANAVSNATAVGYKATASGDKSMAFGYNATAADSDSIAFGDNASAGGGNIAIGHGSQAPSVTTYSTSYLTNNTTLNGYISLGGKTTATSNDRILRRITNVADGSDDQDAVTVAQLKQAYTNLEGTIKTTDTKISDTYTQEAIDSKIATVESKITASKTKYFSINTSSDTLTANADSDGASTSGAADAMAIGPNASATSSKAVAIGNNVSASGKGSIALGTADNPATGTIVTEGGNTSANPHVTSAEGANSVAIGTSAIAQTDNSVALGTRASVYTSDVTDTTTGTTTKVGQQSIAIGYQSETRNTDAISIGSNAKAYSNGSTAVGNGAFAQGADAIVLGTSSRANGASSGILGKSNTVNGSNTYAVGSENNVNGNWGAVTYSGLYGSKNTVNPVADTSGNTTHGMDSFSVTGNSNIISQGSYSDTVQNISILGNSNTVTGANSDAANAGTTANITILGGSNTVTGRDGAGSDDTGKTWNQLTRTSIIGYGNKVNQAAATTSLADTQILGNDVTATLGNSVYLGTGSAAKNANVADAATLTDAEQAAVDALDTTGMTDTEKATAQANAKAAARYATNLKTMKQSGTTAGLQSLSTDTTYDDGTSYTYAGTNTVGVITVGSVGNERRIQNVAAGLVSATSTDAVNGSQLYALTRQIRFGGDNSSFGTTTADDKNVVARGSNEKISITGGSDAVTSSTTDGTTTYTVDATKLTDNNIAVVANTDTNALHVQLASNLKDLNTASLGSGSGDSYKATIKLDGTDTTNGGTLTLNDASGKNGVILRTSGTTTTKDATGAATTRLLVNDKTVATTDDGLIVTGDLGTNSVLKLNNTLTVKGGINSTNAANRLNDDNNNIGVTSDGKGNLTVKLSKDIVLGNYQSGTESADKSGTLRINGGSYYSLDNGSALSFYKSAGTANGSSKSPAEGDKLMATLGIYQGGYLGLYDSNGANEEMLYNGGTTNGIHRLTYKDIANNKTYDLATLNDYTNFKDDAGHSVSIALDKSLTLKGGASTTDVENADKWTTGNISIVSSADTDKGTANGNGTMTIRLAKNLNLGTDGSVVTGATTINNSGLTNGSTTLNGTGLTIANGPSVTTSGIAANGKITRVDDGKANTDAANVKQVKAATSEVANAGANVRSVSTSKGDNGQNIYTVNVDNLAVKVTDGRTVKGTTSVALKDGLVFADGTNTTATVGDNGTIKYNVADAAIRKQAVQAVNVTGGSNVTITPETNTDGTLKTFTISATHNALKSATLTKGDNDMSTLTITGNDGDTASVDIKNTHLTVSKDATAKTVTFTSNDGTTPATILSLSDFGAASTGDMNAAVAKATTEVKAGTNATLGTLETDPTDQHKIYTVNVDNLGLKQNGESSGTVTLANGINFADGTNTSATVSDGKVTFDLKKDITGIDTVTASNSIQAGNVKVGKQGTDSKNYVTGLDNKDWTVGQTTYEAGRAATEDQLKAVSDKVASGFQVTDGTTSANIGADKKVTLMNGNYTTARVTQATDGATIKYDINTAQINASDNGTITAPTTDGVATAVNVANAINNAAWKITAGGNTNGTTSTELIKPGDTVSLKAGDNLKISQSGKDFTYALAQELTGITSLTTSANEGYKVTINGSGLTIKPTDTTQSTISLTANGLNNGGKQITNVASGGTVESNAATIGDLKKAIETASAGTTASGFKTKGNYGEAVTSRLDKQLNVVGDVDTTKVAEQNLSNSNVGVVTSTDKDGNATLTVKLNKDINLGESGSVTTGSTVMNSAGITNGNMSLGANGLTIQNGPKFTNDGIDAANQKITGVADGSNDNDAVNMKQLRGVQSDVNTGWTIKGKDSANADVSANIGKGKTVTYDNGNYTKSVVAKDTTGASVKVDVTTGTLTAGEDGKITSTDGLVTTGAVAAAVNNASWKIQDGNKPQNVQQVKAGDTVSFKAGDNLSLDQNGTEFTYKLNKTLMGMTSVTAVDDKQNTAVLNGEGLKVSDKDGNSLTQHATEIRLHDATKAATDTTTDVVLNKQGLQNGGHTITGVANGTVEANSQDAVNGSQLYELQQKVTNGWKITGNDTTKASNIGNDKTVSFVNGDNSYIKARVDTTNTGATVSYTAQTASLTTTDGKAALTGTTYGLVTGTNLTNVLNSLSWTAQSSQTGTGQNNGSTTAQSITAGTNVGFIAGDNMILTQNGTNFTYALNSNLTGMNTITFTGLGNGASNLTIGLQNGGGANPDQGYYITGLSNTKWDQSNYEGSRAATEAQLRDAIDKVSAATGTGGFGLTADEGANNGGETKVTQTLGRTIAIQGDGTYGADGRVVKQGNISTVAYTDNAGPTGAIKVKLNKDIDLSEAGSLTIGASKVSAGSIVLDNTSDAAKKIALNSTAGIASIGGVTVNGAEKTVNGLSNTTWNGTAVSGRAATENQLVDAINEVKTQAANSELHIKKGVYAIGKDSQGQDITDTKGKNSVSIDVVNANGTVDGQVVINDVAKASELGPVGELADNLKNPAGGSTTVVQAVNKVNQKVDDSLKQVNGDISNAVAEAKKHTEVSHVDGDSNVTIDGTQKTDDNGTVYKLGLNKEHLDLNQVHIYGNEGRVKAKTVESETVKIDDKTKLDKDGLKTGNTTVADGRVVVGGDNGIKIEANGSQQTISGLSNKTWTGKAVSGRAATEDQLQQAVENATATAAQNEQHIQAGQYDVGQGKNLEGKPIGKNSVAINVISGDGTKPGDVKGQVVINNVAKADELGDVAKLHDTVKNADGHPTSTVDAINNLDKRIDQKVGDNTYSRVKGKEIADGDSATTAIGKLNNRMNDIYTTAGQHSSVSTEDANLTLSESKNASGGTEYKLGLNKDKIDLGNVTIKGNDGSISAKAMTADSFTAGDTVVNKDGIKIGDKSTLTGDSLKVDGKTYVDDKGVNANGQVIRNVGEGKDDGDAVNKKQLNEVKSDYQAADAKLDDEIRQTNAGLNEVGRAVNKLGNRLNRVGAGAAALAALHPGTYDPNDKWDFSAGVGHYHDANAVAIGAYYHPNDTTILSIGGSMGGGENMVNAGITWKMGRSGREQAAPPVVVRKAEAAPVVQQAAPVRPAPVVVPVPAVTPAPVTTPAPVKSVAPAMPVQAVPAVTTPMTPAAPSNDTAALAQILARQTAILEKLAQNQAQAAPSAAVAHGDDIFPDVPDNHWAYAYVAKLEKAGALKGFKHPAVLKSPMMTRDDFASVLYTAMANGATTNPALNGDDSLNRLAQEFKAELKNVKA